MQIVDIASEEEVEDEEDVLPGTAMMESPEGSKLGSVTNCWGNSKVADFMIRGFPQLLMNMLD